MIALYLAQDAAFSWIRKPNSILQHPDSWLIILMIKPLC